MIHPHRVQIPDTDMTVVELTLTPYCRRLPQQIITATTNLTIPTTPVTVSPTSPRNIHQPPTNSNQPIVEVS